MGKRKRAAALFCAAVMVTLAIGGCGGNASKPVAVPEVSKDDRETSGTEPVASKENPQIPEKETEAAITAPVIKPKDYPKVDGSTATIPLSLGLYRLVTGASEKEAEAAIVHTKTTSAYNRLMYRDTDLVLAYEPAASVYSEMDAKGIRLNIKPIGRDALVFMTNEKNPVRSLTGQQIKDIYSGRIRNWADVGGEGKTIQAFQRPQRSGSQTLMDKLVMKGTPMDSAPMVKTIGEMGDLIENVASYNNQDNAIGYSVYFYARNMYQKPELRFMAVDGVMPSNQTIKNGSYPYVNEFYAAIREDEPEASNAHILFDWLTTDDGQALVERLGYVGMKAVDKTLAAEILNQAPTEKASIKFAEQERLLLDGQFAYGTDGVYMLDENMKVQEVFRGVTLPFNAQLEDMDKPVMLEEAASGLFGLYSLKSRTWLLDPVYDSFNYEDENNILFYQWNDQGEKHFRVSLDGALVQVREDDTTRVGDYFWSMDFDKKTVVITDQDGNQVKALDLTEYMDVQFGRDINHHAYLLTGSDNRFLLLDELGEILFDPAVMGTDQEMYFEQLSGDNKFMEGKFVGEKGFFIYDLVHNKLVTAPEDEVSIYMKGQENDYIVKNKEGTTVYDSDGMPIRSPDGHNYHKILGEGYYAYEENGRLIVQGGDPWWTYTYPLADLDYGTCLAKNVFQLSSNSVWEIYQGETFLMKLASYWENNDYIILEDGKSKSMVLDKKSGDILYESDINDQIISVFDRFLISSRGSYLYVLDYQGRCALKLLDGDLSDD